MEIVLAGRTFTLELAITPEERQVGLSGRASLPRDAGMLFVFAQERTLGFWMKDTLIPLDILFIDSDQRIVDIQTMEPQPEASNSELTRYHSGQPAMYALEVNAGIAAELGLKPGMRVTFR